MSKRLLPQMYSENVELFTDNTSIMYLYMKLNCWERYCLLAFMRPCINSASYEYKNKLASKEAKSADA